MTDAEASCITNEMAFLIQLLPYKSWLMPVSRPGNYVAFSFCYEKKRLSMLSATFNMKCPLQSACVSIIHQLKV